MIPKAVSPLHRRMIEDMTIRQFGAHTPARLHPSVYEFTALVGRAPDQAEPEVLRRYQLHLASLGASYSRMNQASTALRLADCHLPDARHTATVAKTAVPAQTREGKSGQKAQKFRIS